MSKQIFQYGPSAKVRFEEKFLKYFTKSLTGLKIRLFQLLATEAAVRWFCMEWMMWEFSEQLCFALVF